MNFKEWLIASLTEMLMVKAITLNKLKRKPKAFRNSKTVNVPEYCLNVTVTVTLTINYNMETENVDSG